MAEANLSFALNTRLFALVPPPDKTQQANAATRPRHPMPEMPDGLGTVPMMAIGFALSFAVGRYVMPEIYRLLGM